MRSKKRIIRVKQSQRRKSARRSIFKNEAWYAKAALSIAVVSDQVTLVPQQQPTLSREDNRVD